MAWQAQLPPRPGSRVTSTCRQLSTPKHKHDTSAQFSPDGGRFSQVFKSILRNREGGRRGRRQRIGPHSGVSACPHMLTLSWEPSTLTWPLTSPKFSHTPSKRAQANSHSSLTIPHHTLVRESLTSDTPPPSALASPFQPRRVGCGSTSFAPQTCTVHSYTPAAAGFTTSRDLPCRPPPHQPAHTYGKLPEVTNLPSPPLPAGDFYQVIRK